MPVRLRSLRFLNSPISARAKIFWGLIHQNKKRGISRFGVRAKYKPQELVRSTFRTTGSGMESPCGCSGKLYHSAGSTDNFVFLSACTFSVMQRGNHMGIRPLPLLPSDRRFRNPESGTLHHFGRSQIGFPVCTIYNLWQHNCSTHSFIVLHCSFLSSAFGYPERGLFLPFLESVVISARMWYNGDSF